MLTANIANIVVDSEFKGYIPPLSEDEAAGLLASCLREGIRDVLVVWAGTGILLDGHNRLEIANEHGLPFTTREVELPDRKAAVNWIIDNQLGRRNLHPDAASILRGKRYANEKTVGHGAKSVPQNEGQNQTAERLAEQTGVSRATIERDADFAEAVDILDARGILDKQAVMAGKSPLTKQDTVRLAEVAATDADAAAELFEGLSSDEPERVAGAKAVARGQEPWQNIHSSKSNEWYTPEKYIASATAVMGGIDVDPASNDRANEIVKAGAYYTAETDGLSVDWPGRVWLNPPWGGLQEKFVDRLMAQVAAGVVTEAVVLVNAHSTDTRWFQPLWNHTLCFTDHRINYYGSEGSGSTHGSVFVYIGPNWERFAEEFAQYGAVVRRVAL